MLPLILACRSTPTPAPAAPVIAAEPASTVRASPASANISPASGGTLTLHLDASAGFSSIEVICPSGFRQRAALSDGVATLAGLPAEPCAVSFKGGPAARFSPLTAGIWRCQYTATTMLCAAP